MHMCVKTYCIYAHILYMYTRQHASTHIHVNTGTVRMPCSSAGSLNLMESQTHCLLQIQLSSTERGSEIERENTGICLQGGDTGEGGGQKKINDFTPMFEKGKCMVSAEMWPTFRCPNAFLSCAEQITKWFSVGKMNSLMHCTNFI